ncbi:hypothetical protein DRQ53_13490 [bacterium]|nr:MAG: hypothetical protein DRQ53_13490 [bacterium]
MSLRRRLLLLIALLTLLPALPAAWVTHELLGRATDLGLREEIDDALQSGVRQARVGLQVQRALLNEEAQRWKFACEAAQGDLGNIDSSFADPDFRVELGDIVLAPGAAELATPAQEIERNAPPLRLTARTDLDGTTLHLTALVDPQWREDALNTSESLQLVRSMRAERSSIERGFLLPFIVIYGFGLVVAIAAAFLVARRWTRRVDRLVQATDAVAAGDRDVQVSMSGRDELARLGQGFDRMVNTLDAQSRHLVEMETMAGWREMARALAHEVKNPLTPIQLTVEEMRERYQGDDPAYSKLLDECTRIVIDEVASLREVVGRFRDFSRPVELQRKPFDANALLRDIGAMQRDMQVELDLADDLPPAFGDQDRLRQVLMNLASNAREASDNRETARLGLSSSNAAGQVVLVFEDDGPGIHPSERAQVFEPYRTGKKTGLGLGLALVKGIILAHEGSIEVEEGRWGGAKFVIVLPTANKEKP